MVKKITFSLFLGVFSMVAVQASQAEERATKKDAEAMVKKAVAHYKKAGEKAFADFTAPSTAFVSKDLYITVTAIDGTVKAHGANSKLVGKNLISMKDPDGKPFIKEMVDTAKSKKAYWLNYKFTDPISEKVLPKEIYCESVDDNAVCGGVYKEQ